MIKFKRLLVSLLICLMSLVINNIVYAEDSAINSIILPKLSESEIPHVTYDNNHKITMHISEKIWDDVVKEEGVYPYYDDNYPEWRLFAKSGGRNFISASYVCKSEYNGVASRKLPELFNYTTTYEGGYRPLPDTAAVTINPLMWPKGKWDCAITFLYDGGEETVHVQLYQPIHYTCDDVNANPNLSEAEKKQECERTDDKFYEKSCGIVNNKCITTTNLKKSECDDLGYNWNGKYCDNSNKNTEETYQSTLKHTVVFDENYGIGLDCDSGYYVPTGGVCQNDDITPGNTIKFPASSKNMYNSNFGYLLGWTNTVIDGTPVCSTPSKTIIDYNENYEVNEFTDFYACYKDDINGTRYALNGASADGKKVECGSALEISYCYRTKDNTKYCQYTKNGDSSVTGIVYRDKIALNQPNESACDNISNDDANIKCTTKKQTGITGKHNFYMCVNKNDYDDENDKSLIDDVNNLVRCERGYILDENYTSIDGNLENGYVKVDVRCISEDDYDKNDTRGSSRISLSVTSGNVGNNREGIIKVNASSKDGKIEKYYFSETYKAPTSKSSWKSTNSGNFTITTTPGIIYIWVMDSEGNISNGIGGAVFDTVNTNTTISKLELYDANGQMQSPTGNTAYKVEGITSSKYIRLSNNLSKDSVIAENGFNPFDMEYKLEVSSPTVTVYATLTSTDSKYVDGYEPRTVNLDYGINTVLIKIMNNEGKVRTYTILVTRTDDRTADNTLSNISVDVGKIEFNSNKAEYKIEIPKETKNVEVKAKIASDVASYIEGYEPGNVVITGDTTVKLIKVKSETGSTRTYVLTFVKEGTDIVSKKTLQLFDLNIPGVYVPFEEGVSNYSLTVDYANRVININAALMDENSSALYYVKRKGDSSYTLGSNKGINLDVGENFVEIKVTDKDGDVAYYRLTIIRKEFGLEVSNDTSLKDLKVLGYNIEFEPNKKEYTVRIKREKSLVITAVPNSNRSEVFIRGNEELTGFSTVRVKVVAENGEFETYSIDIKKDAFNKTIEIIAIVLGVVIIIGSSCIIVVNKKKRSNREYYEE